MAGAGDAAALRDWLRQWVADVVGLATADIDADRPLEEFGLSSRDAVALSGELEDLLGTELSSTLVWDHPTIAMLARHLSAPAVAVPVPLPTAAVPVPVPQRRAADEPVAVVGLGCRVPGASGPEEFWDLLATGTDAVGAQPAGRGAAGAANPHRGGYLADVAGFDAEFFGIAPREATAMDPQQRLLLEVAWEALEHAGVAPASLRGSSTGVFVGVSSYDYALRTSTDAAAIDAWTPTGVAASITANRLSYLLDLRGPSLAIDTACSSSLVAVHQACRSLRSGECDSALAAGVNLLLNPAMTTAFGEAGALAPDGRCKAFAADADGIARGEGAGVVVLKRLSDARRDGDAVLAVIRGSAVNSDGRSNGLTAPNPAAQADLLRAAYADAGLATTDVDYVEAHGTGTLLGDPIEAGALGSVLGAGRAADRPLLLGSVKTNLGHLEAAAGIVGMIKVVLAMRHGRLPASLHFHRPNPHIPFDEARLQVVDDTAPWPRRSGRATAGVSGFGFGGTNAHVVLEEVAPEDVTEPAGPAAPAVLLLSAAGGSRLRDAAGDLAGWLDTPDGLASALAAVGRTLARRGRHRTRAAVVAREPAEALTAVRALAAGRAAPGLVTGTATADAADAVWVFSGYGSQWPGMARVLLAEEPAFAAAVAELEPLVTAEAGFSLTALLRSGERAAGVERAQVAIFGVQVALTALLRHHGVTPAAVVGHSMGEVAAAVAAGALPLADAVRVITVRSRLLATVESAGTGAMAVVGLSGTEFDALTAGFPDVSVAVHAAPHTLTVAGAADQVRELVAHADRLGRTARLLDVRGAGHTAAVDPILGELAAELAGLAAEPLQVPLYSTVLDAPRQAPGGRALHGAGYWVAGARRPVRFTQAVAAAIADGHSAFLEVSPHPIALPAVAATAAAEGRPDPVLAVSLRRDTDDAVSFRSALALLHVNGIAVRTDTLHAPGPRPALPRTRWRHTRYWAAEPARPAGAEPPPPGVHVELPDGRHAWQTAAVAEPASLITAAAEQVLGSCRVDGLVRHAERPDGPVELSTVLVPTEPASGLKVQVHARARGGAWVLLAEATAVRCAVAAPAPAPAAVPASIGDRLRTIVAGVMGFAPEQLDPHVPLVELGLDSLMAVRIKNIVEHELGTPPLVLGMLRGAGLAAVQEHVTALLGDRAAAAAAAPVGPRDATERLLLRTWSDELGDAPPGVVDEVTALPGVERVAARLGERLGRTVDPEELRAQRSIAGMADLLRAEIEGDDGAVLRMLRPAPERGAQPPLFLFHPAGGPCSVYQPLVERLGEDQAVYGLERVEGELGERVEQYLPLMAEIAGDGPYRLAGWSFGGALAYETAQRLVAAGAEVDLLAMIDTVRPEPDGVPEPVAALQRWQRFAGYVERTYGRPLPLPLGELAEAGEEQQLDIVMDLMERAGLGMSRGVLQHQRTSWIDSRVAERHAPASYPGQVLLYRAEAMHDGALELDPRYGRTGPDGGWDRLCPLLEIVPVAGDHLAVIDPPVVSVVAGHLRARLGGRVGTHR